MTDENDLLADFRPHAGAALTPRPTLPPRLIDTLRALADPPPPQEPPQPAEVGVYRIRRERGRGGMGVVYEADDPALGRRVAVKVLTAGTYADPRTRERFLREARTAAALRHDHLIPVYAVETPTHHPPYLVMPFIDGPTLAERVRVTTGLPPRLAAEYARQIADALVAIHAVGVVHLDVKPGNVLLDAADGRAKLTDFGLARPATADGATTAHGVAGTPAYLSPEQVTHPEAVDGRADVYALGVTLYECLTGVPPFRGSPHDLLRLVTQQEPVPPRQLNPAIPVDLQTICLKCLAKAPSRRYPTAAALRDDLDRFLAGSPVTARPVGLPERVWRWCRRSPKLTAVSAALALSVAGGGLTVVALWQRAEGNAKLARDAADRESEQRQAAEENLDAALGVVNQFCVRVSEDDLLQVPGAEPVRRKLLADAVDHYKRFVATRRHDPRMTKLVADALGRLSSLQLILGEVVEAVGNRRAALAAHQALLAEQPDELDRRAAVADDWLLLCTCLNAARQPAEAISAGETAIAQFTDISKSSPTTRRFIVRSAEALVETGIVYSTSGQSTAADRFRAAVSLLEPVVAADPSDGDAKRLLANALSGMATMRMAVDDTPSLERVRELRNELLVVAPNSPQRRFGVAQANLNLGVLYKWGKRPADATSAYQNAVAELERLVADSPKVVSWRRHLARTRFNLALLHRDQGRVADTGSELRAAFGQYDRLTAGQPFDPPLAIEACTVRAQLVLHDIALGDKPAAVNGLEQLTARITELHAVPDLTSPLNDRLTRDVVCVAANGWQAVDRHDDARKLVSAHAAYLRRLNRSQVAPEAWKLSYRAQAEVARREGGAALLRVSEEWVAAFPKEAGELAEAGRLCAITADPTSKDDPLARRASELFRLAIEAGWQFPSAWKDDTLLKRYAPQSR